MELSTSPVFQQIIQIVECHFGLHIPKAPALDLYQKTSTVVHALVRKKILPAPLTYFSRHPSFVLQELFQLLETLRASSALLPDMSAHLPDMGSRQANSNVLAPFRSLDVFEIMGDHTYPSSLRTKLNQLLATRSRLYPGPTFLSTVTDLLSEDPTEYEIRRSSVIGRDEGTQYCVFVHASEIATAMSFVFDSIPSLHPITALYFFYTGFVEYIHPFLDGNGRCFRVCTNLLLRNLGGRRLLTKKLVTFPEFIHDHFEISWDSLMSDLRSDKQ